MEPAMRRARTAGAAGVVAAVACCCCLALCAQPVSAGVALACSNYETSLTPVDINITMSGILKPTSVDVDTGEWVYYADNSVNKIVRFTGESIRPTVEVLSTNVIFGSITGLCLSPYDQALYVVDNLNNSLFEIPCETRSVPTSPNEGPYCIEYSDYAGQYTVELENPVDCSVDKAGNIYITQVDEIVLVNQTAFSNTHIPVSGAFELGPIVVDLHSYDIYAGDNAQGKVFRMPCITQDASNTQCLDLGTTPTFPNPTPRSLERVVGLALNRGETIGDFELIVADGKSTDIIAIKHPKSSDHSSGELIMTMGEANAPEDIAIDPVHFDILVAQPRLNSQAVGALSRITCQTEVFAPSPNVPVVPSPSPGTPPGRPTTAAAVTTPDPNLNNQMSGGSIFLLILFLVVLFYFGGGCVFLRVTRGVWTIPNIVMWQNFWGLVIAGFYFAFCCGRKPPEGGRPVAYDGGKIKTTGTADQHGPQYDNYDTMHDDL